jgi:exopolysaccharide production protein ExoZ
MGVRPDFAAMGAGPLSRSSVDQRTHSDRHLWYELPPSLLLLLAISIMIVSAHDPQHMVDSKTAASHQLIGVQYLRAIAALMVAYFHSLEQLPQYSSLLSGCFPGNTHLANGVDLFFVISGFIMVLTSSRASPGDFAMRRIIRIVPLYWTLTSVLLVLLLWTPDLLRTTVAGIEYALKSFLFIPYPNPGQNGQLFPLLVPGWSLNLEMFFYTVFTLVLFLPRNRRVIVAGTIFLIVVWCAPLFGGTPYGREIGFFGDFRLFEFLFGMMLAQWYAKGLPRLPVPVLWIVALAGFIVLFWGLPFLPLTAGSWQQVLLENGLPAAIIVFAILSLEERLRRHPLPFLAYLGDASYSMYLSHLFSLGVARVLWIRAGLDRISLPYAICFAIVGLAFTLIGTILVYRYVEQPWLHVLQRAYRRQRKPVPQAGGAPL